MIRALAHLIVIAIVIAIALWLDVRREGWPR